MEPLLKASVNTRLHAQVFLTQQYLAIVMEAAKGGNLHQYILRQPAKHLSETQARWIFQQLIVGLDFCHQRVTI